ncbi:MAG: ExbD/TolR family protein [Pseudobdellovibrionaceae bacterium]
MPIHAPGERYRYNKMLRKRKGKREVAAVLQLTAMVDMFTVLVVFLLQNYNVTGQVLYIPKEVTLPKAEKIKELAPAVVVTISNKEVLLDKNSVITAEALHSQESWMIENLRKGVVDALALAREEHEKSLRTKLQSAVEAARGEEEKDKTPWNKVTIQADKGIDFLTVKKVMYTVSEAGAGEINFAVNKEKAAQ